MADGRLDPAARRELARLVAEAGVSPQEAAERLGIPEATARWQIAQWYAAYEAEQRTPRPRGAPDWRRRAAGVALVLAFVPVGAIASAALFGGGDGDPPLPSAAEGGSTDFRSAQARAPRSKTSTLAAYVDGSSVRVYEKPDDRAAAETFEARKLAEGRELPVVFLVLRERREWLKVQLPARPNDTRRWIRRRDARLRINEWRLRVVLSKHRILLWRGSRFISRHTIAVGRSVTPTPEGRYFLSDLVKPPDPDGLYGSYAFGLSAYSNVVTKFGTGDGQIGIHGTNNSDALGTDVSHGCIRVADSVIQSYARHLPLGTPVVIRA